MINSQRSFLSQPQRLALDDAKIDYYPQFLGNDAADELFQYLSKHGHWQQYQVKVYGKTYLTPRLSAWYGDKGYTYSGLYHEPAEWLQPLQDLREQLTELLSVRFNSVLLNLYRDGQDSMGCHSDNEKELGVQPVIASVSLGVTRDFILQHKHSGEKYKLPLLHGDLLVMHGNTQTFWKHSIRKSACIHKPRINLTFRYIC